MSSKCYGLMLLQLNIYISPLDVLLLLVTLVILLPFFKIKHCIITRKHYTITTKASMQTHHNSLHSVLSRQWHNKHTHAVQWVQSTILCIKSTSVHIHPCRCRQCSTTYTGTHAWEKSAISWPLTTHDDFAQGGSACCFICMNIYHKYACRIWTRGSVSLYMSAQNVHVLYQHKGLHTHSFISTRGLHAALPAQSVHVALLAWSVHAALSAWSVHAALSAQNVHVALLAQSVHMRLCYYISTKCACSFISTKCAYTFITVSVQCEVACSFIGTMVCM